jgi:hypothetical protein
MKPETAAAVWDDTGMRSSYLFLSLVESSVEGINNYIKVIRAGVNHSERYVYTHGGKSTALDPTPRIYTAVRRDNLAKSLEVLLLTT